MTIADLLKKEGREEGRKEGRDEEKRDLVLKMSRNGYDLDTIAELSDLSIEQIVLISARPS